MKRLFFAMVVIAAFASCAKEAPVVSTLPESAEISFQVANELGVSLSTKATAVTALDAFNVVAENSASSDELWSLQTIKNGSNYNTGKYWPVCISLDQTG